MKYFSFKCFKSYYYFFIYWAIDLASSIMDQYFEQYIYMDGKTFINEDNYLSFLVLNISDLLAGFLVLITHFRSKSIKEETEKNKVKTADDKYELIYNDLSIREHKFILIFSVSVIEFVGRSTYFIYFLIFTSYDYLNSSKTIWLVSIDVLARIIFLKKILKTGLYKHHIVSIILIIIGFFPMTLGGIIDLVKSKHSSYLLAIIPRNILFPLADTLSKIILTDKFVLPQYLMFYKGIINFSMHTIIIPILLLTKTLTIKDNDGNSYFSKFKSVPALTILISNIFSKFLKQLCIMEILYFFTPQHVCFINSVSWLIIFFKNFFFYTTSTALIIIYIFTFLFIIFGTLLFNEMIILNIYGLNKDTKVQILEREKKDTLELDDSTTTLDDRVTNKDEDSLI